MECMPMHIQPLLEVDGGSSSSLQMSYMIKAVGQLPCELFSQGYNHTLFSAVV